MIIREGHLTRYIQASLLSSSRITALNSTGISMLGLGSTRELLTLTLWDLLGLLLAVDTVRALQGLVRETKYRVIWPLYVTITGTGICLSPNTLHWRHLFLYLIFLIWNIIGLYCLVLNLFDKTTDEMNLCFVKSLKLFKITN